MPSEESARRVRALVVDDDDSTLEHVGAVLHRLNFDVENSFDGLDALRRCQSARYDIIVCDVRMPRLSGLSFLNHLAQTENVSTPVIMLSAIDDGDVRRQALSSGAVAYLVKPVSSELLSRTVEESLK